MRFVLDTRRTDLVPANTLDLPENVGKDEVPPMRHHAIALLGFLALPGCYYFEAQEALGSAESALESAKTNGLEQSNPYQYYLAEQYLERAKIENRESDFSSAKDFARKAEVRAQTAGVAAAVGVTPPAPMPSGGDLDVRPVTPPPYAAPAPSSGAPQPELVVQPEPESM
jgi:hypothetical protein